MPGELLPRARHAIERAQERYNLLLTTTDIRRLEQTILAGKALIVRRADPNDTVLVQHKGVSLVAVVYRPNGNIVTFLPRESLSPSKKRDPGRRAKHRRWGEARPVPKFDKSAEIADY